MLPWMKLLRGNGASIFRQKNTSSKLLLSKLPQNIKNNHLFLRNINNNDNINNKLNHFIVFPSTATAAVSYGAVLGWRNFLNNNNNNINSNNNKNNNSMVHRTVSLQSRFISVRGKNENNNKEEEEAKKSEEEDTTKKAEKEKGEEENENNNKENENKEEEENNNNKKKKKKAPPKKKTLADHFRDLKHDYNTNTDIYNCINFFNFVIFTAFCLCSTGTASEEQWWLTQWGLCYDNRKMNPNLKKENNNNKRENNNNNNIFLRALEATKPWSWLLHSFLTNNFLSMTYAMILMHSLGHPLRAIMGGKAISKFIIYTAIGSGILMQSGQFLYYHVYLQNRFSPPETQYGPWDVMPAMFMMYYLLLNVTPWAFLNSFSGWIRYACFVGQLCIFYFDWQPTLAGTAVGWALCRYHPRLRALNFKK